MDELNAQTNQARRQLVAAQEMLPKAQEELAEAAKGVAGLVWKIDDINARATTELAQQEREQAIFSGAVKIIGGVCSFIPVGQPFGRVAAQHA